MNADTLTIVIGALVALASIAVGIRGYILTRTEEREMEQRVIDMALRRMNWEMVKQDRIDELTRRSTEIAQDHRSRIFNVWHARPRQTNQGTLPEIR